jgi:hypothetical protein
VFCTTALLTWKLDATDVSRMAGHANYRITLDMYVGPLPGPHASHVRVAGDLSGIYPQRDSPATLTEGDLAIERARSAHGQLSPGDQL